jgi:glycerol-3-phosphate cytidylyltransferase-like family protein
MWWYLILAILLMGAWTICAVGGVARPSARDPENNSAGHSPRERVTINASCVTEGSTTIGLLSQRYDLFLIKLVRDHNGLTTLNRTVPLVHTSTRKGFASAVRQLEPDVHVDENDVSASWVENLPSRIMLIGGRQRQQVRNLHKRVNNTNQFKLTNRCDAYSLDANHFAEH